MRFHEILFRTNGWPLDGAILGLNILVNTNIALEHFNLPPFYIGCNASCVLTIQVFSRDLTIAMHRTLPGRTLSKKIRTSPKSKTKKFSFFNDTLSTVIDIFSFLIRYFVCLFWQVFGTSGSLLSCPDRLYCTYDSHGYSLFGLSIQISNGRFQ